MLALTRGSPIVGTFDLHGNISDHCVAQYVCAQSFSASSFNTQFIIFKSINHHFNTEFCISNAEFIIFRYDFMCPVHLYPHTDTYERGVEALRMAPRLLGGLVTTAHLEARTKHHQFCI